MNFNPYLYAQGCVEILTANSADYALKSIVGKALLAEIDHYSASSRSNSHYSTHIIYSRGCHRGLILLYLKALIK